jgi:hypothetical protein
MYKQSGNYIIIFYFNFFFNILLGERKKWMNEVWRNNSTKLHKKENRIIRVDIDGDSGLEIELKLKVFRLLKKSERTMSK